MGRGGETLAGSSPAARRDGGSGPWYPAPRIMTSFSKGNFAVGVCGVVGAASCSSDPVEETSQRRRAVAVETECGRETRRAGGGGVGRGVFGKMAKEAKATGETRRVMMAGAANLWATATATTKTAVQSAKMLKAQSQFGNNPRWTTDVLKRLSISCIHAAR